MRPSSTRTDVAVRCAVHSGSARSRLMDASLLLELAVNGAFIGMMYALVAAGIVLIYKTSGIANLAQGALAMTGAYMAWIAGTLAGLPIWLAAPLAALVMFGIGALIERFAMRRMIGQPL